MKIFSNEDIRTIEEQALADRRATRSDMCRELGPGFANEILSFAPADKLIVVFAGPDLCGAYALETARCLFASGRDVTVYLFNVGGNRLSRECTEARNHFVSEADSNSLCEITGTTFALSEISPDMVIVDGIFGIERQGPLPGGYQQVARFINESGAQVVSLDVPSGLSGDMMRGLVSRNIIHATLTLTIGVPRMAFFMPEYTELVGRWKVVPFDFGIDILHEYTTPYMLVEASSMPHLLPARNPFATKDDFGNAILFAGSYGMMGAAVLAARGALRAGCGKLTVESPRCGYVVLQTAVPEAMFSPNNGDMALNRMELDKKFDAVAIGPGIGRNDITIQALEDFLKVANANRRELVLDADALNCIALRPTLLDHIPRRSVITPHAGEFDRLFGAHPTFEARIAKAIEVVSKHKIIIVLKSHYTAVVRPDGRVLFNPTGTPALATGGSGDVLTGIILSFMAQGLAPEMAATAAVYVHGLAGRIAERRHGQYGTTASDIADAVGQAIVEASAN